MISKLTIPNFPLSSFSAPSGAPCDIDSSKLSDSGKSLHPPSQTPSLISVTNIPFHEPTTNRQSIFLIDKPSYKALSRVSIEHFKLLKVIGKGSFGKVSDDSSCFIILYCLESRCIVLSYVQSSYVIL